MAIKLENIKYKDINIPVIFEEHKTLPIFNLQLVFKNSGYINDTKLSGLTKITSLVLNEGTLKEGVIDFSRKLENNAIDIYASNGLETFVIEVSSLKDQYELALKYLAQVLKDPNLNNDTLNKIKKLQLTKLAQKEDDFDYIASSNLKSIIYKDTILQNTNTGTKEDIEKITLKDVQENIKNIINLNNLIIVSGGKIKYKNFKNDIIKILDEIKVKESNKFKKIKMNNVKEVSVIKKDTQQSYIYFASKFNMKYDSSDNYKTKIASFILGSGGFGSRLMEEIRVKHGLAYSVHSNITNKKSHSNFNGYLQTKLENTNKAKEMVEKIVKDFVKNGVTLEELNATKKFLLGSEPLRTETFSQKLNRAFSLFYQGLDFNYSKKELELINDITLNEINSFIKSHDEITNLTFSIVTK